MSSRTIGLSSVLERYIETVGVREHPALAALRAETDGLAEFDMRSSVVQAQLLALLIEIIGARAVLEIGCFTGYGTLAMALALPADGRIVSMDVNEHWAAVGRRWWREAGVEDRIDFRATEARNGLASLSDGTFDLVYVDADKKSYPTYVAGGLRVLRPRGLLVLDNVLWSGAVADPDDGSRQTVALRNVTRAIQNDPGLSPVLLPIGDGLLIARKR